MILKFFVPIGSIIIIGIAIGVLTYSVFKDNIN